VNSANCFGQHTASLFRCELCEEIEFYCWIWLPQATRTPKKLV